MKFWIQVSRIDVNRIIMAELSVALDYTSDIDIRTSCPSSHSLFQWLEKKFLFSNCWPFEFESDVFRLYSDYINTLKVFIKGLFHKF